MSKEYREKLANQNGGHNKVIAELRKIVELKVLKERVLSFLKTLVDTQLSGGLLTLVSTIGFAQPV
jgi:hypothetical protein